MPRHPDARPADEIVRVGRLLAEGRYVVAGEGNLSVRLDAGRFLITPAGARKGELAPEDVVAVDLDGRAVSGPRRPSSEWRLHAEIYRRRPDAGAVCHAHPPNATAFACARRTPPPSLLPEALLLLGDEVPLAPYATPGTDEVAASLAGRLDRGRALLLASHGAVTWADDLAEAFGRMEVLERLAEIALGAERLGGGVRLTHSEALRIREARRGG